MELNFACVNFASLKFRAFFFNSRKSRKFRRAKISTNKVFTTKVNWSRLKRFLFLPLFSSFHSLFYSFKVSKMKTCERHNHIRKVCMRVLDSLSVLSETFGLFSNFYDLRWLFKHMHYCSNWTRSSVISLERLIGAVFELKFSTSLLTLWRYRRKGGNFLDRKGPVHYS